MNKTFMTKMRGLEPVVAAVLLIVVAVIGAVLVYLWFAGYVTKSTSQAEQMTASERLKIEAALDGYRHKHRHAVHPEPRRRQRDSSHRLHI
jgi:FlaG/FlaF family flagellin (archaellin)